MASEPGAEGGPSLAEAMVVVWVLFCVFLVVSMQLGFAMVEVGCCREAHRKTILAKNVLDLCMSVTGFGLSCKLFGPPSLVLDSAGNTKLDLMFFHSVFCATAVTICSGAMAERAHMVAYLTGSVVMASVVYFTLASSAWGEGGLFHGEFHGKFHSGFVYHDFAGSGIVHLSGGTAALVGTVLLGRRIVGVNQARALGPDGLALPRRSRQRIQQHFREDAGAGPVVTSEISSGSASSDDGGDPRGHRHLPRQPRNGWPRRFDDPVADGNEFGQVQHLGFQAMGTFTLWVGWYGFNAGGCLSSSQDLSLGAGAAAIVAWNTTLAASGGGVGTAMYCFLLQKELDVPMICNGVLSGLVAITAGCQIASPTASILLGLIAGLVVLPVSSRVLQKARIDDPVDAIPVHFSNGLLGVLSVPFMLSTCEALGPAIERTCEMSARDEWRQLAAQAWGALTIIGVTASMAFLVFFLFAVSEVASSLDSKQLRTAAYFVQEMLECADADQVEAFTRHWQQAMKSSPLVAGYLVRYSKDGKDLLQLINETRHIPELLPALTGGGRLRRLLRELQTAERDCSSTALEAENWRPATFLARLVKGIPVVRHLTLFRLRVSPSAELSGVGPAAPDGLISVLRGVLLAADKDSRKLSLEGEMLCQEVKALAETIEKNQSALQHAMSSPARGRSGSSPTRGHRSLSRGSRRQERQDAASSGGSRGDRQHRAFLTPPVLTPPIAQRGEDVVGCSAQCRSVTSQSTGSPLVSARVHWSEATTTGQSVISDYETQSHGGLSSSSSWMPAGMFLLQAQQGQAQQGTSSSCSSSSYSPTPVHGGYSSPPAQGMLYGGQGAGIGDGREAEAIIGGLSAQINQILLGQRRLIATLVEQQAAGSATSEVVSPEEVMSVVT